MHQRKNLKKKKHWLLGNTMPNTPIPRGRMFSVNPDVADFVRMESEQRFHFGQLQEGTYERLLKRPFHKPPRYDLRSPMKYLAETPLSHLMPYSLQAWVPNHTDCRSTHRYFLLKLTMSEMLCLRNFGPFLNLAPASEAGFIWISLCER